MLAIRLVAGSSRPDPVVPIVLPVRPATEAPNAPDASGTPAPPPTGSPLPTALSLPEDLAAEAAALATAAGLTGRSGEIRVHLRPLREPGVLVLVGIGAGDEAGWRAAGAALARADLRETSVTLAMPVDATSAAVRGLAEGALLASYRFRMRSSTDDSTRLGELRIAVAAPEEHESALETARTTARMTAFARDLTNMPSSVKGPQWFAEQIADAARDLPDLHLRVRGADELAEGGFGGILAVGGGSAREPKLVELGWHPAGARTHVVLVGKGITFDTGGISIKPRDGMKLMRKDMAGAAAVLAATLGAAALNLPVRITTLAPLAENMVSGSALRPGDVVRHYGGTTSESTNSDAEGRLVLADALAYAVAELAPDLLVDLATLTGANAVALGKRTGALYSDNDQLAGDLLAAIDAAGESAWRMPLPADYVEYLGSDIADLYSAPAHGAGSVTAALFLREFTGALRDRWVHVDMSAPSWADGDHRELSRGATGWGVRGLLRWLATLDAADRPAQG